MPNLGPSTTHTRASTTQATPAHCQAVTTSSSTHRPAAMPTSGTPRLKGATRLAG